MAFVLPKMTAKEQLRSVSPLMSSLTPTHLDECRSFVENRETNVYQFVNPPIHLNEMRIGDQWIPFEPLKIIKVSDDPPIFVLRNFLPPTERQEIMNQAIERGLEKAQTKTKTIENNNHRVGSSVAWLTTDESKIGNFMTRLAARLFLHEELLDGENEDFENWIYYPENLQVVKYDLEGRFELHHDGLNRTLTVLTYLNGVAGTWFPFADAPDSDIPTTSLQEKQKILRGKQPGKDGLCIIGKGQEGMVIDHRSSLNYDCAPRTVYIQPGDAVVFYNYKQDDEHGKIWNWRSLHCGLPAVKPKWIATNWFCLQQIEDYT